MDTAVGGNSGGRGPSFSTVSSVATINAMRGEDGSRAAMNRELEGIRPGQQVTTYSEQRMSTGGTIPNTAENPVTWTKKEDGDWRGSNGTTRTNSEMVRELKNTPRKLGAGEITTESHVRYTSDRETKTNGVSYRAGVYDVMANKGEGPKKYEQAGRIATYNGTRYGVAPDGTITHIPSGMRVGNSTGRRVSDTSDAIKNADSLLKSRPEVVKTATERYKYTIRGD